MIFKLIHVCFVVVFFFSIFTCLALQDPSVLLAHEVAYVLGQMQNPYATPYLIQTLTNESIHPMVRHEVLFISKKNKKKIQ